MKKIIKKYRDEILRKEELLNHTKTKLKEEFVGIDKVIDEVIDSISSWFLFPDLQERPVVVNLWGLTGTGKTELVNKLVNYLKWENQYYSFDLRNNKDGYRTDKVLSDIYSNGNGKQILLLFDEFQNHRTIDDFGNEKDKTINSIIWDLVDSGKYQVLVDFDGYGELFSLIKKIKYFLNLGMVVSNGLVVKKKKEYFNEILTNFSFQLQRGDNGFNPDENLLVIPDLYYGDILHFTKDDFSTQNQLVRKLTTLNGSQTVKFLSWVLDKALAPKTIDFSKSLIFVVGNLDEAYQMSKNFDADINADEFYETSLKINITDIKEALKKCFRSEQIARLGNSHIIYPAFNPIYAIENMKGVSKF